MTDTTARLATTAALSPANTYASGVLTAGSNAALSVDGVAVNAGDVILVKNEAAVANNGLYTVTAAGSAGAVYVLTRHVDMSTSSEFVGAFVPVGLGGAANSNSLWLANPATPFQLGTTAVPFTQLNAATSYTAGNGINIAGNVVSAVGNANNVTVSGSGIAIAANYAGQTSITTLGTVTIGTWNGSLVGAQYGGLGAASLTGYLYGNGTGVATASTTIPNTAISGLGTVSTQAASAVVITGGTIDGITFDGGTF
jgi:hypothetical protein